MASSQGDRRTPGQRAGLSTDRVLDEARRLSRERGIDGLTMRALAGRLGVAPNALYSHVSDRSALLDALLDDVLAEVSTDDLADMDWRAGLIALMGRSRRLLLDHADLLPHYLSRPTRGPNAIRLGEATLAQFDRAGLKGDKAAEALRILLVYTFGFVALEAPRRSDATSERAEASAAAFAASGRPRMAELADSIAGSPSDRTFEIGLGWLVDGIEAIAGGGST